MGIVLVSPKGITLERSARLEFSVSNNEVEYKVLLARYQMANQVRATQGKDILWFKAGHQSSKQRVWSLGWKNSEIFGKGEDITKTIWPSINNSSSEKQQQSRRLLSNIGHLGKQSNTSDNYYRIPFPAQHSTHGHGMCSKYLSEPKLVRPNRCIYQERTTSRRLDQGRKDQA